MKTARVVNSLLLGDLEVTVRVLRKGDEPRCQLAFTWAQRRRPALVTPPMGLAEAGRYAEVFSELPRLIDDVRDDLERGRIRVGRVRRRRKHAVS